MVETVTTLRALMSLRNQWLTLWFSGTQICASPAWEYQINVPATVSQCCAKCGGFGGTSPKRRFCFPRAPSLCGGIPPEAPRAFVRGCTQNMYGP